MKWHWIVYCQAMVLLLLGGQPIWASKELIVIYDSGNTQSIAPFLVGIERDVKNSSQDSEKTPQKTYLGPADIEALLPIRSKGLTPGVFESRAHPAVIAQKLKLGNARPFFLIGTDTFSRKWLHNHRKELVDMGAVGMLVAAETTESVEAIAQIAPGLQITLGSGADIGKALGIDHYPVLITATGIRQ